MIGALQWLVSLGRFDIFTATMTMSRFRVAPWVGHLARLERMYGNIHRWKEGVICVRVDEADYSNLSDGQFSWVKSVYDDVKEQILSDAPRPLGKPVMECAMWM